MAKKNLNNQFGLGGKSTVAEGYVTKGKNIIKLAQLQGANEKRVFGYLITKDAGYGEGVLICCEDCMVSLPKRYLEVVKDYTSEQIDLLTSGRVFLANVTEIDTPKGKTHVFDLLSED